MRISELTESTRDEKDSHDISVSFSHYGPNINLNLRQHNLSKYYEELNLYELYNEHGSEFLKELENKLKPINKNAENQIIELTNAYVEMLKAIIIDASNKTHKLKDKK